MADEDLDELEVLVSAPNEAEASIVVAALDAQGIKAEATGGYTASFMTMVPGDVQVVVRRGDLERAREVLAELQQDKSDFDAEAENAGEPEP